MNELITQSEWERFKALRARVFNLIEAIDEGYHKSYEGAMEIVMEFPNIFEAEEGSINEPCFYCIKLHCYLLVDGRHEDYDGETFKDCLDALEGDVRHWESEWEDEIEEYRRNNKG